LKNFYLQGNFCAYWLLTLNYIWVYFWNAIWLFYQLYIHACSEANVKNFFFLRISLCFLASSVKRLDGHVLASGRARLCRSLIWQHAVWTSMFHVLTRGFCFPCQTHTLHFFLFYHVVLCVFSLGLILRFWHSLHISSHSMVFNVSSFVLLKFCAFKNIGIFIGWNTLLRYCAWKSFFVCVLGGYCYICAIWIAIFTFVIRVHPKCKLS
jgi:hypothetical protein